MRGYEAYHKTKAPSLKKYRDRMRNHQASRLFWSHTLNENAWLENQKYQIQ